ncbi:MAG: hypothetical protein OQK97_07290 [Deltaproteobacteria bacterium]|jgi:hypothetical protein|nr:hypothetical protein [Deltaproteobacteria bacterium]MCW8894135.1 hypothetical protein [Deltaproteobacteria bacterium]
MSRSRIILLLLVVLSVAIAYAWIATPKQRRVAPGQAPLRQADSQRLDVTVSAFPAVADLDFSGGGDYPYQAPQKNLFGPLYLPPKPNKPRPVRPAPKVTKPARPQKVTPVVVQPPGPKPIQPLEVLGYLNKAGATTVFLSSKQGEVYLVKAGDMFAADLIVRSVSDREITIARRQTDQQVVLQLGETKSQRLPKIRFQSDRPEFQLPPEENPDQPTPGTEPGVDSEKAEK